MGNFYHEKPEDLRESDRIYRIFLQILPCPVILSETSRLLNNIIQNFPVIRFFHITKFFGQIR